MIIILWPTHVNIHSARPTQVKHLYLSSNKQHATIMPLMLHKEFVDKLYAMPRYFMEKIGMVCLRGGYDLQSIFGSLRFPFCRRGIVPTRNRGSAIQWEWVGKYQPYPVRLL